MKRAILNISEEFLEEVDSYCRSRGYSRSELIRESLRKMIYKEVNPEGGIVDKKGTPPKNLEEVGYCNGHFERGVRYKLTKVLYENINGEGQEQKVCPKCIDKLKGQVRDKGGVLYINGEKYELD